MRNTPASMAVAVNQLMSCRPIPWRRCSGATASKFKWATSSPKCMMANAAILRSRRATTTEDSGPEMKCCTRAGVHDQVRPVSIRSRDISAISRASLARASPNVAISDMTAPLAAAVPIGGEHQLVRISRLECRVSGVRHDAHIRFGPRTMQVPRAGGGTHDVVASLNDGRRYVPNARHVVQQLTLAAQESAVHEIVALDARHRQRELVFAPLPDVLAVAEQEARGRFPNRPCTRGRQPDSLVAADQALVVGTQEVVALVDRDGVAVGLPGIGENLRCTVLIEPADFGVAQQENPAQHEFADALGIGLRVGERQGAAPGPSKYQPALYPQVSAQSLDVGDQVPGRILDQACARAAAPAASLIEHHDAIVSRVEELARALVGAGAGPAVQEHGRFAGRIAALFIVDLMHVRDAQVAVAKGFDRRIQLAARGIALTRPGSGGHGGARRGLGGVTGEFLLGRRALGGGSPRCGA